MVQYTVCTLDQRDRLGLYISRQHWSSLIENFREAFGRPPKVPAYDDMIVYLRTYVDDFYSSPETAFVVSPPIFLHGLYSEHPSLSDMSLPIIACRDESVYEELNVVTALFLEDFGIDGAMIWLLPFLKFDVQPLSFHRERTHIPEGVRNPLSDVMITFYGYTNPVVDVETPHTRFKRAYRRIKNLSIQYSSLSPTAARGVTAFTLASGYYSSQFVSVDTLDATLASHDAASAEYWKSRGIQQMKNQPARFVAGSGFDDFYVVEATTVSGESGAALFSRYDDVLYWDFSNRGPGRDIGNALIYAGKELAAALGCKYLNLGVGFFSWKDSWADRYFGIPSIRVQDAELLSTADYLLSDAERRHHILRNPDKRDTKE